MFSGPEIRIIYLAKKNQQQEQMDPSSVWHACLTHGTDPYKAKFVICERQKVGYLLDIGQVKTLTSHCFEQEFPTSSQTTSEEGSRPNIELCLYPPGFKLLVLVDGISYIGEIVYTNPGSERMYRFHRIRGTDIIASSPLFTLPTSAFRYVEIKNKSKEPSNGRLLIGIGYNATQNLLRKQFKDLTDQVPANVRELFDKWIGSEPNNIEEDNDNTDSDTLSIADELTCVASGENESYIAMLEEMFTPK